MNFQGIQLLRMYGLPGPRKEKIVRDISEVDLDYLYDGADENISIVAFDKTIPIDQLPLWERDVHKYGIKREDIHTAFHEVIEKLHKKKVYSRDNMRFLFNQTYSKKSILYSGRASKMIDWYGGGTFSIDMISSQRTANTDYDADFIWSCPLFGDIPILHEVKIDKAEINPPKYIISRLIQDVRKIEGPAFVDFEVYKDTGTVFYHDMCMQYERGIKRIKQ